MEKGQKTKNEFDQLKQVYKTWQQFMSKSKIKMRKKVKKDKKEYYDFDYTRGQYYYNYPEYHINFATPEVQMAFFKDFLQQQTKPISDVYHSQLLQSNQIQSILKPQQFHDFLKDIRSKFQRQITTLRIQKSLYQHQNAAKHEAIDFMQDQIRSFNCRLVRFENVYFTFQKSLSQRLQDRTTTLKLKKFDEMHFADIQKGDFVVFLRMEGVQQRLSFQFNRLKDQFELSIMAIKSEIMKRCYEKRGANIKKIEKIHAQTYIQRKSKIEKHFIENDPVFFDAQQNLKILQKYLQNLNYTKQMNKFRSFFDVNYSLKQLDYIPSNQTELKQILYSVCFNYFPNQMVENLYTHKKQHLCYRLNYFASIILRTISQSYNFVIEIKEKDLHGLRTTMKRQLQTIFTNQADKLFNILEYQIICLVDQESYQSPYFPKVASSENENIFKHYFKVNKLVDPFTRSILNLVCTSSDKTIKQVVASYVSWVLQIAPQKLKYLSLYYKNFHSDNKSHLVNLLNAKLIINAFSDNLLQSKFQKVLNPNPRIDENLMKITYLLYAINNIQIKKQLDNFINAQIAIMYKVKFKLNLLEYKHQIPFQMTPQFLTRFTQSNYSHDFISETQLKNPIPYPQIEIHDKVCRLKNGSNRQRVQVRRIIPQNPFFEGKKILYSASVKQCNEILEKIHNMCAFMIEQRQNYLHQQKLSGIVDRFQLVNNVLKLEIQYQNNKLLYMEELLAIYEQTIDPQGIFQVAEQLYKVKYQQVYFDLNQTHYQEHYKNQTELWSCKANLLAKLRIKQIKAEDDQKAKFRQSLMKNNHVNNLPEISSIYYSDELAMEAQDNIVQQAQEESLSEVISQSQFVMNSSKYKSDLSAISSQYHVKNTFKQILGRNSANAQAVEHNRRQELMGRKKKKLLNDSVLGGLLHYDNQSKYYRFIHKIVNFMKDLELMFSKIYQTQDPGVKKQYFQQINSLIDNLDPSSIKQINLIDQNMLNRILSDCNRAISKVVEKYKLSSSTLDEYCFFNSQIFKSLIQNSNFANLNDLRGLYTCLNIVKIYKAYPQYLQDKLLQNNIVKQFAGIAKKYSSQSFSKDKKFPFTETLIQKYDLNAFIKLFDTSNSCLSNKSLIFLSNNSTLSNTVFALNHSIASFCKALLISHYEQIFDYRFFLTNLELLEAFGVYFDDKILSVIGIQNKLFIRRKIQSTSQRLTRLFKLKNIQQLLNLPNNCILLQKKQQKKTIQNQMHIFQNIQSFEDFTAQLGASAVLINSAAEKIRFKLSQKTLHQKLQILAKILPYANTYIHVISISANIYKQMFQDNYKQVGLPVNYQRNKELQKVFLFQFKKLTAQNLTKNFYRDSITDLKSFCKIIIQRKHKQFQMPQTALERYYDCMEVKQLQQPYRLSTQVKLKDIFDYYTDINKKINIITWIQCKLLLFGAQLIPQQLLYFRSMLQNISFCSQVFFRDESSRLINYNDIVKMKIESLDSNSITQKYINAFLNYQNLKSKYKSFLDGLGQLDINNEGKEIINIIYIGNKKVFNHCNRILPYFLSNYCSIKKITNQTNNFIEFATKNNPNRYLKHSKAHNLTFSLLKTFMWDVQSQQKFKNDVFFLEQRCQVIKQTLNSNNTKMKDMTIQLSLQLYTRERMCQLHAFLQIPITKKSRIDYAFFLKKLQQKLLLGLDKLNPIQKYLSKFIQKILKEKPDLVNLKDEIIQKIYESRFYEELILTKLNSMSIQTLNKQLKLYQVLFQNYHQRQHIRENRIIKNTLNKVLVPKIIINPYLQSPLILENYFFAAALKLSYIDSFLNKLKNRAILVQLAEGGFGFLLKISELDQCVQSLCKGIITFTQKQFYDRFRTFLESYDELKEKYKKCMNTNQKLKNMIDICRQEWGKQIKSVIYGKLNSYIGTIHSKQKSYQSIFNIIKSLQLQIAKKIDVQYQQKMKKLQEQNIRLKQQFIEYQKITAKNARTSMQQSKDMLYNSFKKDVESILNKEVIKDFKQLGEKQHQQQEQYMSTILLKRLRKQKAFYEMKISNMESKLRERSNDITKLKEQLTIIQNTLTSDQYKNSKLSQQIRHLVQKNIEIQDLKRQIHKKQEEQTINKLKLIKINEHLQGRVTRLQQKNKLESSAVTKQAKKNQKDTGIQAVFLTQKRQRRNFKIKTQYSQQHSQQPIKSQNKVDQGPIWRQKWQNSQRKFHVLMSKIVQSYEVYKMNKNSLKLADRIGQIFEQCMNNHILKKK